MIALASYITPPHDCGYLPNREAITDYVVVGELSADEYSVKLAEGWRKFGMSMFRPVCIGCQACQSIRVPVADFQMNRSQKRAFQANKDLRLEIGPGDLNEEKMALYDRFHKFREETRGWHGHINENYMHYVDTFLDGPCAPEEWRYFLGDKLLAVGYVDRVPDALSDVYFYYDPDYRNRSLGIFNVLKTIENARQTGLPYVYLGYYVEGCQSLAYKATFKPNEIKQRETGWVGNSV